MAFLIGTDEAGYGPNLGPLVVSVSVWRVPDELVGFDLYRLLGDAICSHSAAQESAPKIPIADSKRLYKSGGGLRDLELGLLPLLTNLDGASDQWSQVWNTLASESFATMREESWYDEFECEIPVDASVPDIIERAAIFSHTCDEHDVELKRIRSTAVPPAQFNSFIQSYGNKASTLSEVTLDLVMQGIDGLPPEPMRILCDKHGGRNHYAPLLQARFADQLVRVKTEGRSQSTYQVGSRWQPIEISFQSKGESFLPSALASMASKYLRELAMKAFNHFWLQHVNNLKPTAGYPVDAKRFKIDIQDVQKKLNIDDHVLWRNR